MLTPTERNDQTFSSFSFNLYMSDMVFRVKGMLLIVGLHLATCISIEMYLLHYMKIRCIFNLKKKKRKKSTTVNCTSIILLRPKEQRNRSMRQEWYKGGT